MYRSLYAYNIQFVEVFCQYVKELRFNFQHVAFGCENLLHCTLRIFTTLSIYYSAFKLQYFAPLCIFKN